MYKLRFPFSKTFVKLGALDTHFFLLDLDIVYVQFMAGNTIDSKLTHDELACFPQIYTKLFLYIISTLNYRGI